MIDQFPVPLILLVVGVLAFAALAKNMGGQHRPSFEATPIMTPNEWEFFNRLSGALPECRIFPQVAMAALMTPDKRNDKRRQAAFWMISQKRVDYAVYGLQKQLMCVVELDDRMHDRASDQKRDGFLKSAKIRCIRWQSRQKPSTAEIRAAVLWREEAA